MACEAELLQQIAGGMGSSLGLARLDVGQRRRKPEKSGSRGR
jgi:hypothetical protein